MRNGITDTLFSTLQNNPSVAAGTCTFAVAFALVAGNAFYAQSGHHPDPIWATRDAQTTQSIMPSVKPVKVSTYAAKKIPTPLSGNSVRKKHQSSKLVANLQAALIKSGDYSGEVDGLIGPLTRASIASYQERHNLKKTGEPSQTLLQKIERDTPTIVSTNQTDPLKDIISGERTGNSKGHSYDRDLIKKIQAGITNAGIAAIDADGIYGSKTEAAIMDFQRRNKLKVTGKPDINVLEKLIILGLV